MNRYRLRSGCRSASQPKPTRLTSPSTEQAAKRNPAVPGATPEATAESTRKTPVEVAAAEPRKPPRVRTTRPPRGRPLSPEPPSAGRAVPRASRPVACDQISRAIASATAAATAQRQPNTSAMPGTASPPSRVAAGMDDCLMPNATPRRCSVTNSEMPRLADGWATALPRPPIARPASSHTGDGASPTAVSERIERTAASAVPFRAPSRCTSRPPGRAHSPETPNRVAAAKPKSPRPTSRSALICTARAPVRNAGSTPRTDTATAWRTALIVTARGWTPPSAGSATDRHAQGPADLLTQGNQGPVRLRVQGHARGAPQRPLGRRPLAGGAHRQVLVH